MHFISTSLVVLLHLTSSIISAPIPTDLSFLATIQAAIAPDKSQHINPVVSYTQNGVGACNFTSLDTDLVVGLPQDIYNATIGINAYCGNFVILTSVGLTNISVAAKIADISTINGTLTLSNGTMNALMVNGEAPVSLVWNYATPVQQLSAQVMLLVAAVAAPGILPAVPSPLVVAAPVSIPTPIATPVIVAPSPVAVVPETTTTETPAAYTPAYTPPAPVATPAAKSSSSSSSSSNSGSSYSGVATYYYQGGNKGACGNANSDSAYIIAVDMTTFAGGKLCGKSVTINSGGKSIQATIADACESCGTTGHIDLSSGAFNALASPSAGQIGITWSMN